MSEPVQMDISELTEEDITLDKSIGIGKSINSNVVIVFLWMIK